MSRTEIKFRIMQLNPNADVKYLDEVYNWVIESENYDIEKIINDGVELRINQIIEKHYSDDSKKLTPLEQKIKAFEDYKASKLKNQP